MRGFLRPATIQESWHESTATALNIELQKRETPLDAGFRQSGSAYLPPGQTSSEAGVHRAGFCARRDFKAAAETEQAQQAADLIGCSPGLIGPKRRASLLFCVSVQ